MGTSRKHARKVARKAVKENRAFRGRRVDYVIVDELTDAQTQSETIRQLRPVTRLRRIILSASKTSL